MRLTFYSFVTLCSTLAITPINNTIYTISEGVEMVFEFWLADNSAYNESCVAAACPAPNNFNLCPNDTDFSVLRDILKTATGCMKETFCGTTIDRGPFPSIAMSAEEWLLGIEVDGMVTIIPGTCYLSNLSNIEFDFQLHQDQNITKLPLHIVVKMPDLHAGAKFQMDLSLHTRQPLIAGEALSFTIPNALVSIEAEFISTIAINQSIPGSEFKINLINSVIKTHPQFCGLDMPLGFPNIITTITEMTRVIVEKSSWAIRQGNFFEKFFQSVFSIVSRSC